MALDFSGLDALKKYGISPDKPGWFQDYNGIYGGGQGDWYLSDPNTGYRALTQNDINSYVTQTQQQMDPTQEYQRQWAQYNGAIPFSDAENQTAMTQGLSGLTGPSADYRAASIGNGLYGWVPKYDERFIPGPQQNSGLMKYLAGPIGTTLTHFQDARNAYQQNPERLLFGGLENSTPIGTKIENSVLGTNYQPIVNQTGGPTQQTYDNASAAGYETGPTKFGHQAAPFVIGIGAAGAAAGSQGLTPASEGGGLAGIGGESAAGAGGGSLAGGSEAGSLYGDAGNTGGGMWDLVDDYGNPLDMSGTNYGAQNVPANNFDPGYTYDSSGNYATQGYGTDYSGNNFDPGYMYDSAGNYSTAPGTQVPTQGIDWQAVSQKYGPELAKKIYNQYIASKTSNGKGILDTITGDPLQAGFNSLPFLYSLYEANRQGNQINPILARVSGLADSAASNQNGLVASAVGPYDRETMAGRDAAMTDQALRGVRGSSFGDQALGNYDLTRARGRGELLGSTQAKSLGLQGDLLNSLLKGQTQAATSRNMLIGAGLSASGKLFQPQNDPFGLQNLLSLGNIFGNP